MLAWLVVVVASAGSGLASQEIGVEAPHEQAVSDGQCQVPGGSPPADVHTYYADHNLVHAFSTPEERALLVREPEQVQDERMIRIGRLMARLANRGLPVDPGSVYPAKRATGLVFPRTDLLKVRSWSQEEDGALVVELEAYHLEPEANLHLVGQYEEGSLTDGPPSAGQLTSLVRRPLTTSREIHRWVCAGGSWKRMPTTTHFLVQ